MFPNPTKNLAENAFSGKGMGDQATKFATDQAKNAATEKAKNLVSEMGSQGLSSTGGVGMGSAGLGNVDMATGGLGASAAGMGGKAFNSLNSGTGAERSNPHAYNRDTSHSGYGGHNTNTDSYGRDTTNSETYGRGNINTEAQEGYSMSSDRDRLREHLGQQGNTGSGFGTGDLARGTGTGTHHHATDNEVGTTSTQTGLHSGEGVHAQQYYGRTDATGAGSTYASGESTGIGHHPHAAGHHGTGVGHHQAGEGIHARQYTGRSTGTTTAEGMSAMGTGVGHHAHGTGGHHIESECEFCHSHAGTHHDPTTTTTIPASHSEQDRNKNLKSTSSGVLPASTQERNVNTKSTTANAPASSGATNKSNLPQYGETIMTTTTSSNTTEGPSPYHLRPGETIVEKETRIHRGVPAGTAVPNRTTGSGTGTGTGTSQMPAGQFNTGENVTGQPQQRRKASMGEKLMERMGGKTHPTDTVEQGADRVSRTVN